MILPRGWNKSIVHGALAAVVLALSACATRLDNSTLEPVTEAPDDLTVHSVLVATNREPDTGQQGPYFERARSPTTSFARFDISVPKRHKKGKIELPGRGRPNLDRHFASVASDLLPDEDVFLSELRHHVANNESKTLMIFVHGFDTEFAEGVYYVAQMKHDAQFKGTAVLLAWPSGGRWLDYVYDRESIMTARDALEQTLRLASQSGAERIGIIAHSMGCYLTMETLRSAAIAGDPTFNGKLHTVILATPDIAVDVFKSQMHRIGADPKIAVQRSRNDKFLRAARIIAGESERIGSYEGDPELAKLGVEMIDLTDTRQITGHYAVFGDPEVLNAIFVGMEASRGMRARNNGGQLVVEAGEDVVGSILRFFGAPLSAMRLD